MEGEMELFFNIPKHLKTYATSIDLLSAEYTAISNWWHIYFSQNALMPVNHPFVDCWEENLIFILLIN